MVEWLCKILTHGGQIMELTYTERNGIMYPDLALPEQTNYIPTVLRTLLEQTCTLWQRPTVFMSVYLCIYPVSIAMGLV